MNDKCGGGCEKCACPMKANAPTACTVRRTEVFTPKDPGSELSLISLNEKEFKFLSYLVAHQFLPMVQFVMLSSENKEFKKVSLSPAYIEDVTDTFEKIQTMGTMLDRLESEGFITLDFNVPLQNCSYNEYYNSEVFAFYKNMISEISLNQVAFMGDTATIEKGSIAATAACTELFDDII